MSWRGSDDDAMRSRQQRALPRSKGKQKKRRQRTAGLRMKAMQGIRPGRTESEGPGWDAVAVAMVTAGMAAVK